jgi:hypothetical protein
MAYLAQPASREEYGIVSVGDFIQVQNGIISLVQDLSPDAAVSFNQATIDGKEVITSVSPSAGEGISLENVVTAGNSTSFTIANSGVLSIQAGSGISVSRSTGNVTISSTGADLISTIGVNSSYNASSTDEYIGVFSSTAVTIKLPVGENGRVFVVKDEYGQGSGKITIQPSGSDKIDNSPSYVISVPNQAVSLVFRGGQWRVI